MVLTWQSSMMIRMTRAIEDGDDESGPVKGHFNQEPSIRRAARRGITLVDGDDRQNFLKGNRLVPRFIVAINFME
jgi:hypothetical protein